MGANEILQKFLFWANQVVPEERLAMPVSQLPFSLPRNVLVVPSRFIGDNILLTPFLRNLRRNLERNARIDILATPATGPLYRTLPGVDRVYLEKSGETKHPRRFLEARQYDTVLFCRYSLAWSSAALRANIPQRVGFDLRRLGINGLQTWGKRLTHTIPSTPIDDPRPQVEIYLDMLRELGLTVSDTQLECHLTPADEQRARQLLKQASATWPDRSCRILIHASSASPGKTWPLSCWEVLLEKLNAAYHPMFVTTGSKKEGALYDTWSQQYPLLNLCGKTTLTESIAVLSQMDLVITLDTAIAHMAAIAKTPRLIVIYGPTNERQWRPHVHPETRLVQIHQKLPCRPCMARTCEHKSCIRTLTPDLVLQAVEIVMRPPRNIVGL